MTPRRLNWLQGPALLAAFGLGAVFCSSVSAARLESKPALPCTLKVFEDQSYEGCDESRRQFEAKEVLSTGFESGRLLSAAAEHAVSLMRAWRTKNLDGIFNRTLRGGGSIGADIDFVDPRRAPRLYLVREKTRLALQEHFDETASIDSMVVEILADSVATVSGEVMARLWIARTLRDGDTAGARVIDRFDYAESWMSGQIILGFEEVDASTWAGERVAAGGGLFPHRVGSAVAAHR